MSKFTENLFDFRTGWMALLTILSSAAMLAGALAFEYIGGLSPCVLCMYQRWVYVCAAAIGLVAWLLRKHPALARLFIALAGLSFFIESAVAAFHSGVEQQWWEGSSKCQGDAIDLSLSSEELMAQLLDKPVARCDQIPWDLFGISMAGYNMVIALALAVICLMALRKNTAS
ncbi:disulfide bond formation protein B [Kiloniella laminariae]|uniref:disulfide bond formation protein B n=1 Tax=Kiloniella laminariae TaxID=454162 RepID=UPI000363BAB1|nr:disulfide bond formation protein B [Kiloniella laminariae]